MLITLVTRLEDPSIYDLVSSVLASQGTVRPVICDVTRAILRNSISEDGSESKDASRRMLGQLRLRHPELVQTISQELMDEDVDLKDKVEQVILSLSLVRVTFLKAVKCMTECGIGQPGPFSRSWRSLEDDRR